MTSEVTTSISRHISISSAIAMQDGTVDADTLAIAVSALRARARAVLPGATGIETSQIRVNVSVEPSDRARGVAGTLRLTVDVSVRE